jgi:TPR repeat protein
MLIFDGRNIARAVCGLILLLAVALLSLPGQHQARAQDENSIDFFSIIPGKPNLKPGGIDGLAPWGDDMKKASTAYARGDYEEALPHFETAAAGGEIVASWYLGHMYRLGRGVEASTAKALQYYQDVAEAFTPEEPDPSRLRIMIDARVRVADILREGDAKEGVKPNSQAAFALYSMAASYGHPSAQYGQGVMWLSGKGVKASPQKALKWLFSAAKLRHPPAEALLGDLYWKGEVVERDRIRALMWYVLAMESARPEEYPEIFDRFNSMAVEAGEELVREAEARARAWSDKYPLHRPPDAS